MGGRGSWSSTAKTYEVNPGGANGSGGAGDNEPVLGPRVPESLSEALGNQGKPMSMSQAAKGTNPHYSRDYDAYSSSCQRCVLAYEARRRGYDVTALPTYKGDLMPKGQDYLRALSNPDTVDTGRSKKKIESEMQKYGNGARAIIQASNRKGGHVFIAENNNGKITYIDPQKNEKFSNLSLTQVTHSAITRIDNQQFTEYAKNAFTRQKV